jgi:hypothetical protein
MTTAILLTVLGVLSRLLPHASNLVPMGAIALYAGARLPRRWAWAVPLAVMVLSDVVLDWKSTRGLDAATRLTIYATFAAIVALGRLPRFDAGPLTRAGMSLGASTLFFLTSNFATWAAWGMYPMTPSGLWSCYLAAIPFFGNTVAADLIGTGVLFGLDALARWAEHARARRIAKRRRAADPVSG